MAPFVVLLLMCLISLPSQAQAQLPSFVGVWKPAPGSRAVYAVSDKNGEVDQIAVAVVGQDGDAYWVKVDYHGLDQRTIKQLVGPHGTERVLVQEGNLPERELEPGSWEGGGLPVAPEKVGHEAGRERLKLGCGTFDCLRYEVGTGSQKGQVWLDPAISPYGLVRLQTADLTMELRRVWTHP